MSFGWWTQISSGPEVSSCGGSHQPVKSSHASLSNREASPRSRDSRKFLRTEAVVVVGVWEWNQQPNPRAVAAEEEEGFPADTVSSCTKYYVFNPI